MSDATPPSPPTPSTGPQPPQTGWIRRAHLATLAAIGVCGAIAAWQTAADPEPAPDRALTWWITVLAVGTIGGRLMAGSPVAGPGLRAVAVFVSLGSAFAMGVLAATIAVTTGAVKTGLAFSAAALLLALRPPLPPRARSRPPGRSA
jgi:hypothetical protein